MQRAELLAELERLAGEASACRARLSEIATAVTACRERLAAGPAAAATPTTDEPVAGAVEPQPA